ncbi:MAG: MarR family transcriptional regulator, partial [Hyphomicrobiales bacterium]
MQDYGLTNARWRVMQAIQRGGEQTVARIARAIGLKRQGVQRIVNELEQEGFVRLIDNPDHKRARLVQPTAAGAAALEAVGRRYDGWADALETRFSRDRLDRLTRDLRALQELVG